MRWKCLAVTGAHERRGHSIYYGNDHIPTDLVVKCQAIDNAEVIFSRIWPWNIVQTSYRNRKGRCEPLSPSGAHRSTTKSGGIWIFWQTQVIEGLLQDLGGLLRLSVVALEAFSGGTAAALSGFRLFFGLLCALGHGVFLDMLCESVAVAVCPRARSVRMMSPPRHVLPGLSAFFWQPGAV
jgi:hypothetical protein